MTEIPIHIGNSPVGTLVFEQSAAGLQRRAAQRTAEGFLMPIPGKLHLEWNRGLQPHVSGLRACIRLQGDDTELGIASDHAVHQAARPYSDINVDLEWRGSFRALELIEMRRNHGTSPCFQFQCSGEAFYAKEIESTVFRTIPTIFHGSVNVQYPMDAWLDRVGSLGHSANVLVEVPLPGAAPAGWDQVFGCLEEARVALIRGGETGWRGAMVAARTALEKWEGLEAAQFGPGWAAPSRPDREKWTKEQRREALRWWLYQFCHLAAHEQASHWTRSDAIVALSTLASLLSAREP